MLNEFHEIFLQPVSGWKNHRSRYAIMVGEEEVARISGMQGSKWNPLTLLTTFVYLYHATGLDYYIEDKDANVLGYIRKEFGLFKKKDIHIFSSEKEHIGTIKANSKLTNIELTVVDASDHKLFSTKTSGTAIDFPIVNCHSGEAIMNLRRRSYIYENVSDYLYKGDGFYMKTVPDDPNMTLRFLALAVALDFYYA